MNQYLKLLLWDESSSEENAISQLKIVSAKLGGNGIKNVWCNPRDGFDLGKNCWDFTECRGIAISVDGVDNQILNYQISELKKYETLLKQNKNKKIIRQGD